MEKKITPKKMELHGWNIPRTRLKIGACIPIHNIILSLLFDKDYSNIVVYKSFNIDTTIVP